MCGWFRNHACSRLELVMRMKSICIHESSFCTYPCSSIGHSRLRWKFIIVFHQVANKMQFNFIEFFMAVICFFLFVRILRNTPPILSIQTEFRADLVGLDRRHKK